jgi:hypothetical protein
MDEVHGKVSLNAPPLTADGTKVNPEYKALGVDGDSAVATGLRLKASKKAARSWNITCIRWRAV